jgi:hypothetical protein
MKRAEHSTPLRTKEPVVPSKPPENPAEKKAADARERDDAQQERNRRDMGVAEDHRTDAMKKGRRGTFP